MAEPLEQERQVPGGFRLRSGYHLVPDEESWLLYCPDGLFARLNIEVDRVAALVEALTSSPYRVPEPDVEELITRFVTEGIAEAREEEIGRAERLPMEVAVEGCGVVTDMVADLLYRAGARVCRVQSANGAVPTSANVLVCCAGWLPDAQWQAWDSWCLEHGVAWHGCHMEGNRFHLGPFWLPGDPRTARYADVRARRLAADIHPDGLEAYWRYLDADSRVPPVPPTSPAEAAMVAGSLVEDLLAWSAGRQPPTYGEQLSYDRNTGRWQRHPVLPVPRGLMTEGLP